MTTLFSGLTADTLLTLALQLAILAAMIAAVCLGRRRTPDLPSLTWLFGALAVTLLALFLSPAALIAPGLQLAWNWDGKVLSILATFAIIAAAPGLSFREAGFTLSQNGGTRPALLCAALTCIVLWTASYTLFTPAAPPTVEALAFQATMPGLHEEPLFRGMALLLLARAIAPVDDRRFNLMGARIGWGGVLITLFFALGQGVAVFQSQPMISWVGVMFSAAAGFALLWMRERTGSLVIPILAHNVLSVGNQFLG
ncbi:CPBP family glutamic-type intramembrane protease [Caulobacter sp. NIBR2454]|uniref:CPBP family glutamic-type intramembrane protease n=1 Tax=Caulobacter sp. NIBR2454 TaxID=3015996 RepID=UPI0022B7003B|nr:CPBP family glutamic-type intramembrane protease [Caulobacter sp. NIBR2454]